MLKLHSDYTILNKEHTVRIRATGLPFIFWLIISMIGVVLDPQLLKRICVAVLFHFI